MKKNSTAASHNQAQDKNDRIELNGKVIETLPATMFKVMTETGQVVLATLAGKLRQNRIRVLLEDSVVVEVSPYDVSRGRIVWRR